jgi:hypothetical protein
MPMHEAIKYVLGAYLVFAVLLVTYGVIMAKHTARAKKELASVNNALRRERR